jgi:hypothetical protein
MDEQPEYPVERLARLKAQRRARKTDPRRMRVSGKSVFLLQQLTRQRAERARRRLEQRAQGDA